MSPGSERHEKNGSVVKSERIVSSTVMRRQRRRSVDSKVSRGGQSSRARKRRRQQVKSSQTSSPAIIKYTTLASSRCHYITPKLPQPVPPSSRVRDRHRSTSLVIDIYTLPIPRNRETGTCTIKPTSHKSSEDPKRPKKHQARFRTTFTVVFLLNQKPTML